MNEDHSQDHVNCKCIITPVYAKDYVSYPEGLRRCKSVQCDMYTTDTCKICGMPTCSTHRATKNEVTGEIVCKGCLRDFLQRDYKGGRP